MPRVVLGISAGTGRRSRQRVQPHGILYGSRAYLVGRTGWIDGVRYWVLANMSKAALTEESFQFDEDFDLEEFAARSYGVFQEEPIDVMLRFVPKAAADAASFLFHPGQETENDEDGSLLVRFTAGGPRDVLALVHLGRRSDRRYAQELAPANRRNVLPAGGASPCLAGPRPGRWLTRLLPGFAPFGSASWTSPER